MENITTETTPTLDEFRNVEQNESDDEDYLAPDTQELEEADESESDSDIEADQTFEEDFQVQIKDGEIMKLKFQQLELSSQVNSSHYCTGW